MSSLPHLITDLSYILIVASFVTIVFKRLKQPLVLGYIVAGFLAGPHMPYTPSISDNSSIGDWSEIGVIFLMFSLGLEFSFKKIVKMGMRPILSAMLVMTCMMSVGITVAMLFGWSSMDRLFLGGMLAMSSTTIIYKAFDDMNLRSKPFAGNVLSVLILEDILGILLMVVLSAMAVSRRFEGTELLHSLFQLGFFLLLWFLVGVYLIPLLLRRYRKYINGETLLVVCVGLCFFMVVMAHKVGYSPAFGAFMMGSILAETVEAERIEHTVSSLKDLFGAIFFVSVGMLVEPMVLVEYWLPVLVITLAVIFGQMVFGSMSFLVTGHSMEDSVKSGFSLVQIGEFAFIIAALGQTLGVTGSFLYPVVVAVSIVTTFFTPYIIRLSDPVCQRINDILPYKLSNKLESRGRSRRQEPPVVTLATEWKSLMRIVVLQTVSYLTICVAIILFSFSIILPISRQLFTHWPGNIVCGTLTFLAVSPCIRPIVMRKNHSSEALYIRSHGHSGLFWLLVLGKIMVGCGVVYYILNFLSPFWWPWHVVASFALVVTVIRSKRIKLVSIRMERTFRQNLKSREQQSVSYGRRLKGGDLQLSTISIPKESKWGGKTLSQLHFGRTDHIHVAAIIRGSQRINIPGGSNRIYPGDVVEIVSDEAGINAFRHRVQSDVWQPGEQKQVHDRLYLINLTLSATSPLCGHTLVDVDFRTKYHCMVVGVEDKEGMLQVTHAQRQFQEGDILWVVGEDADLSLLKMVM